VLFMVDPIDEYVMQQLKEFDGKKFVCDHQGGREARGDRGREEAPRGEKASFEKLCKAIKEILGDKVEKVT
jgi:molecular chaperone HtpG